MRGRTFVFIGARRRGAIVRAVSADGCWIGHRGPMTIRIKHNTIGNIEGQKIEFHYTIYRAHGHGFADSATDAIEKLEAIYNERTPRHDRPEKPKRKRATGGRTTASV
jgi:hypothetical protein